MVFRGRPSRGCEGCRKAHVKCDEKRPSCSRCFRFNWSCSGYRKLDDLMVCDETEHTKKKSRRQEVGSGMKLIGLEADLSLGCSKEDATVWHFYYTITASLSRVDHAYHLHSELPKLYTKSPTLSVLRLSTQAIANAVACGSCRSTIRYVRNSYTQDIAAMNLALLDPQEAVANETLYAVLLLCGYETITCGSENLVGWATHVKGASAMLIYRSKQPFSHPFTSKLYHFARRSIVLYHIQSYTPIAPLFSGLESISPLDENDEDRLFSLMARLPEIQHRSKGIAELSTDQRYRSCKLFVDARELDTRLSDWKKNLPSTWAFNTIPYLQSFSRAEPDIEFVPVQIHSYPDTYPARLWNLYRVSRIILNSLLICLQRSDNVSTEAAQPILEVDTVKGQVLELVNDICASVPFLSGNDLSEMRLTGPNYFQGSSAGKDLPVTPTDEAEGRNGKRSLLWPLYVASSVTFVPKSQRKWMRQQILSIGETGEPLAMWLADSQSQTLAGGAECFAFDCV